VVAERAKLSHLLGKLRIAAAESNLAEVDGLLRAACELHMDAHDLEAAVALCEVHGRDDLAAALCHRHGDLRRASMLYARAGDLDSAARLRLETHEPLMAAELFERAGRLDDAVALYEAHGDAMRAAQVLERNGSLEPAADLLVRALNSEHGRRLVGAEAAMACRRAGELYARCGRVDPAIRVLRWGGELGFAAKILADVGRNEEAIDLYLEQGDLLSAAEVARRAQDPRRYHEFMARRAEQEGRLIEAAGHYEAAGNPFQAVRLYELGGRPDQAAEAARQGGLLDAAARLYERLGEVQTAADLLRELGRKDEARALLERAGTSSSDLAIQRQADRKEFLNAAVSVLALARQGEARRYEEALQYLEQVPRTSRDFLAARTMMGEVLAELGRNRAAIQALQELLVGVTPQPAHVPALYQYGRLLEHDGYLAGARAAYRAVARFEPHYRDVMARVLRLKETDVRRPESGPQQDGVSQVPMVVAGPAPKSEGAEHLSQDLVLPGFGAGQTPVKVDDLLDTGPSLGPRVRDPTAPVPPPRPASSSPPPDHLVGTVLRDRFRLERRVGRGAQAQVYLARDQVLDREVAIKVLSESSTPDENGLGRFLREARLAARVHHGNCIAIYDFGQEKGIVFIAMEYFEGKTLRELLRKGPIDAYLALRIARDVAAALGAVHEAGIVHRDVKPTNVLVDQHANVRIADFGVARFITDDSSSGMMVGTMKYMSPEQARGKDADRRADVFSLGVVMYEMLNGKPPFGGTLDALIARVNKPPPELPAELDLPDVVRGIVRRCMQRRPEHRYASIEPLIDDINDALAVLRDRAPFGSRRQAN
jgi:tRNA A-37 threonylcarbamoyl transferase component Bud32